jgi:hypothetical protein
MRALDQDSRLGKIARDRCDRCDSAHRGSRGLAREIHRGRRCCPTEIVLPGSVDANRIQARHQNVSSSWTARHGRPIRGVLNRASERQLQHRVLIETTALRHSGASCPPDECTIRRTDERTRRRSDETARRRSDEPSKSTGQERRAGQGCVQSVPNSAGAGTTPTPVAWKVSKKQPY